MSIKTQRKTAAESVPSKGKPAKKVRRSAPKTNRKHPLAIYKHLHIGIVESLLDGRYIDANEEFCRIFGYSKKELLKLGIKDCTHEDDYALDIKLHEQLAAGKIPFYELEKRFVRKDGQVIWVELTRSLVRDEDGKPLGTIGAVIDISKRKHAEQTLADFARQQEALYRLSDELHHTNSPEGVYDAALDAILGALQCDRASILLFDDSGVMRFVAWRGLSEGYRSATEGHSPWRPDEKNPYPICVNDIRTSDLSDALKETIQEEGINALAFIPLVSNGKLIGKFMVYFNTPHDCSDIEIELSLTIGRQLAFGIDRKRAEVELRANEALYRTLARSIPGGGVYVVDKDFRYLVAEGPVTEAFGLSREMLEGRTVSEVFPDERGTRMEERLRRVFAGDTISFETKHNEHVYWTRLAPLRDSIGQAIILTIDITERKQVEESLRQSEERFTRFMEHLPGLAWIKDVQGRYVYANAAAEKAFGAPRAKLYGRTDAEIFPAEIAARFRKNDEQARKYEKGVQTVETLTQDDGVLHYSLVHKFPIPGVDGSMALIGGTAFDITERLRAEEALRESEARFRAIVKQATAGIVRKDAEGKLTFVNEAFCNMLGYPESELLGKTFWQFTYNEDIEENKRLFSRLMMEGIPFKLEKRLLRADGALIWVDVSVSPVMDAEGKPQSAVAVEVDITGRKQAEEALQQLNLQLESRVQKRTATIQAMNQSLREEIAERRRIEEALRESEAVARASEEKLCTLFDLLPVGISFLDPDSRIIQMNSALLNILKLSKEQLLIQAYRSRKYIRVDGTPMPPTEFASARALAENRTIYNVETGILPEDGEVVWTSVSAAPVDVADVGVVVVTVDITESKRAERALQESHGHLQVLSQRLVEVQEEERRALARELHDRVGQTLAALNINLIIIHSQLSEEVLQQIGARLDDSMKLVGETITLVRDVMTDLRPAVLDDYGLEAALESHLTGFTSRYDIKVMFEKPDRPIPRLGPSIEMTFLRIAQEALMNIARHAHAEHVNLSLRQVGESICLTVQDDGAGIESWQAANRPGSHGLTIMRERAEAFGGTLKVSSVPRQGTTVEASIPFNSNEGQAKTQEERL
ncbi:MAG: PAS domain S-box protein [Anaerolineales bacterium]|nr:PAS domain S-box protein [Anaerolineales bacterium]